MVSVVLAPREASFGGKADPPECPVTRPLMPAALAQIGAKRDYPYMLDGQPVSNPAEALDPAAPRGLR